MKTEINYNGQQDEQLKRDRAIQDIADYVSPEAMNILETIAMTADKYGQLSFLASFAGVRGYPVVALWDETRQIMRDMSN